MSNTSYNNHAKLLSALDNPKRLEILHVLKSHCVHVSELTEMTGVTQSNISQHLQVLRRQGVVVTKRKGKEIVYCLSHPKFIAILENVHDILADRNIASPKTVSRPMPKPPRIIDPVCHMAISPKHAIFTNSYKRTTYYFCASGCKKKFEKKPELYV